jgi:DNA processing protein
MPETKTHNTDIKYAIGFTKIPSIGPARFKKIEQAFASLEEAWHAPMTRLEQLGLGPTTIAEFIRLRQEINLDEELEKLEKEQVSVLTQKDESYPALLKEIYDAPYLLFYRGTLPKPDEYLLAVVGSRKYSSYGKQMVTSLVRELAQSGLTIVSGLALGIDGLAHEATLDARGTTLGVLGCGVERASLYPATNRILGERVISSGGCIISEHPIGTPPLRHHFPRRNRIISGLCLGTLVIEAAEKSGALITAQQALEQNREVFAVPGNVTSQTSVGTNGLLKMGARPVLDAQDVLDALNLKQATDYMAAKVIKADSEDEAKLLEHLTQEPLHIDELIRLTNLQAHAINAALTLMEMKGKVRHLGAMNYVLAR